MWVREPRAPLTHHLRESRRGGPKPPLKPDNNRGQDRLLSNRNKRIQNVSRIRQSVRQIVIVKANGDSLNQNAEKL